VVIPAHDHQASAQFFAQIMGLDYAGPDRHFAPARVSDTFTIVFLKADQFQGYHLGFHIGEDDFEPILHRLQAAGVAYGNDPREPTILLAVVVYFF
jgi:hypothetical protein